MTHELVGLYECKRYIGTKDENGWHQVKVIKEGDSYRWLNDAGISWQLKSQRLPNSFVVGRDCPYFDSGYTRCRVILNDSRKVVALIGPQNERFDRYELQRCERNVVISLGWKNETKKTAFIMDVSSSEVDWRDLAFLACIPASSHLNKKRPVVIVPDKNDKDNDSLEDFFRRLKPRMINVFSSDIEIKCKDGILKHEEFLNLDSTIITLCNSWKTSDRIVTASTEDYANVLLASSFAARIDAPLLLVNKVWSNEAISAVARLKVEQMFTIGNVPALENVVMIRLNGVMDVIKWLMENSLKIGYIAIVNPEDRYTGVSRKLSLTAPLYTAHHDGLVNPIPGIFYLKHYYKIKKFKFYTKVLYATVI